MRPFIESIGHSYGIFPAWLLLFIVIFLRFAIIAGVVYWFFYKWKRNSWFPRKIQQKFPKAAMMQREIWNSIGTTAIFASMTIGIYSLRMMGFGTLYFDISDYGWTYFFASIIGVILLHDTYFYWIHRLMHHPRLFKIFHKVHHESSNPTPFTAFSFHPLEAIVEFGFIPIIALFVPIHFYALMFFTIWSIIFNVMGHAGYEIYPKGFTKHPVFQWFNTPTHHNLHHARSGANYSLYFNFWDRIMGTNHPQYHDIFESIKKR